MNGNDDENAGQRPVPADRPIGEVRTAIDREQIDEDLEAALNSPGVKPIGELASAIDREK